MTKHPEPGSEIAASPGAASQPATFTAIAQLLRPQGRRGEMLCERLSDLEEMFQPQQVWVGRHEDGADARACELQEAWHPTGKNAGRVVLKLEGCDSINDAELLKGSYVLLPAAALPELEDDTFYVNELVGCELWDESRRIGEIVDVEFAMNSDGRTRLDDAAPLLSVHIEDGAEPVLVPFVNAWLVSVDTAGKRVVMRLPRGLVEAVGHGATTDAEAASPEDAAAPFPDQVE
jgi:16S rRNA processing protein RimM